MSENGTIVENLDLSIWRAPEGPKKSKAGKNFMKLDAVHDDNGEKTWFSVLAFGVLAVELGKSGVSKGNRVRVSGTVKQKEYQKKDGGVGVENSLLVNKIKVSNGERVVTITEFGAE